MDFRRFLNLALATFVTVGLALAPLAFSAEAAETHASGTNMTVSANMPCCPDGEKSKDCQDCPLVAIWILKSLQANLSAAVAMPLRHSIRTTHSVLNDPAAAGLSRHPPDHPPRNLG
jgi:hypothetical protein